jgi:hypothetical protein
MTRDQPGFAHADGGFQKFAASRGETLNDWEYRMQTFRKGKTEIENHYWYNITTYERFHHH